MHHIEGYQNVAYDDLETVVTVCPRDHRRLERWTRRIKSLSAEQRHRAALEIRACLVSHRPIRVETLLVSRRSA
ncbi:MAG: hypothetical protein HY292_07755 [Planctomycetes bacterium]|nr:hypothetical protein [Planctomycetota bacterium]